MSMTTMYRITTVCFVALLGVTSALLPDPPKPYGTKTIYDFRFTDEQIAVRNSTSLPAPSLCSPLYVGSFFRHGSRNPSGGDIEGAQQLMDRIGGQIQAPEFAHLNDWFLPFNISEESQLVDVGYREHVGLGRRWAERVTELLGGAAAAEMELFASTLSRTQGSAEGFRQGLFEILNNFEDTEIVINNTFTRYYNECPRYTAEVVENPETTVEEEKWMAGPEMAALSATFSQRLQLAVSDLTPVELYTIFTAITVEEGILGGSPWSDLWQTLEEFDVLDYLLDFQAYWERGYAYPITREMSCVVLEEFFTKMDQAKSASEQGSSSYPKGTFMFGDSTTVIPLECLLGLFNDSTLPILAENYDSQAGRTFRASRIDPWSANLAFVLYECPEGPTVGAAPDGVDWPPQLEKFMVQLFFNEISTKVPGACGYDLCPYHQVRSQFAEYIDTCNFNERCDVTNSSGSGNQVTAVTSFLALMTSLSLFSVLNVRH